MVPCQSICGIKTQTDIVLQKVLLVKCRGSCFFSLSCASKNICNNSFLVANVFISDGKIQRYILKLTNDKKK